MEGGKGPTYLDPPSKMPLLLATATENLKGISLQALFYIVMKFCYMLLIPYYDQTSNGGDPKRLLAQEPLLGLYKEKSDGGFCCPMDTCQHSKVRLFTHELQPEEKTVLLVQADRAGHSCCRESFSVVLKTIQVSSIVCTDPSHPPPLSSTQLALGI